MDASLHHHRDIMFPIDRILDITIMGIVWVVATVGTAFAVQVTDIPWAAQFLERYGWLGLFVMAAFIAMYLFRLLLREQKESEKAIQDLRVEYTAKLETMQAHYEAQLRETTTALMRRYEEHITELKQRQ